MINPQELRIGNWVNWCNVHGKWGLKQMTADMISLGSCGDIHSGKPIPLTEEWLVKFGFVKEEGTEWWYNDISIYQYQDGWKWNDLVRSKKLPYVHKLQNLFYELTDKELTICT